MTDLEKCHQSVCETGRGRSGGDGEIFEWKSSEVNTRALPRGQNKFTGEFKMAAGEVISIRGVSYGIHIHSNRNWFTITGFINPSVNRLSSTKQGDLNL